MEFKEAPLLEPETGTQDPSGETAQPFTEGFDYDAPDPEIIETEMCEQRDRGWL